METPSCTCPICGKPISDYLAQDVICPACNTDLSIYRTIDNIPEKKPNAWLFIAIVAFLATIATATLLFLSSKNNKEVIDKLEGEKTSLIEENANLSNSISVMQTESAPVVHAYPYIVRKGDSFWKISLKFHGTGTKAAQIAEDNNLSLDAHLNIGDTLLIHY